jgi:predicted permease
VGGALAAGAFRLLVGALPLGAWGESATLDWTVFVAALAIAIVAALLVALVPAVALWRGDLRDVIGRARTGGISGRGGRLEGGLVVAEVALAVLMAAGAGLLIRSVGKLYSIDPGVDTRGVAVLDVAMAAGSMNRPQRQQALRELMEALAPLPGVQSVAMAQRLPLRGGGDNWGINVEGRPDMEQSTTAFRVVSTGYFETMGIAVKKGRAFDRTDLPLAPTDTARERVVVINEALAKKYFPDEDPIGKRIGTGYPWMERIIGVVENAAEEKLTSEPTPARYLMYDQTPYTPEGTSIVLRVARGQDAASILDEARRTVQRTKPGVAVQEATTMGRVFATAVGPARQVMTLLTLLTGLAMALGAVGVYGVISHFATRRQRDWGIRVALGLQPSRVVGHIVGRGGALVAVGVVIGLVGVVALGRLLASLLYGVGSTDALALAAATGALMAVGLFAAWIPARRASRVDPAIVLREQ